MNIKKALNKIGVEADVSHTDLASVTPNDADLFVMAKDIAASSNVPADKIIVIKNMVGLAEFEEKLTAYFNR